MPPEQIEMEKASFVEADFSFYEFDGFESFFYRLTDPQPLVQSREEKNSRPFKSRPFFSHNYVGNVCLVPVLQKLIVD